MKKLLDELKEQLNLLKEKIEIVESKIDESESEIVVIDKSEFEFLSFSTDRGYVFIKFKECLFNVSESSDTMKSFTEGSLNFMIIKKLSKTSSWSYGRYILTHSLLGPYEAAKYKYYSK
jgi:hypothetical protein